MKTLFFKTSCCLVFFLFLQQVQAQNMSGIGIRFGLDTSSSPTVPVITEVVHGTPADSAGLKVGWYIKMINQSSTFNKSLQNIADSIRGPEGSIVFIYASPGRDDAPKLFSIKRKSYQQPPPMRKVKSKEDLYDLTNQIVDSLTRGGWKIDLVKKTDGQSFTWFSFDAKQDKNYGIVFLVANTSRTMSASAELGMNTSRWNLTPMANDWGVTQFGGLVKPDAAGTISIALKIPGNTDYLPIAAVVAHKE